MFLRYRRGIGKNREQDRLKYHGYAIDLEAQLVPINECLFRLYQGTYAMQDVVVSVFLSGGTSRASSSRMPDLLAIFGAEIGCRHGLL